MEEISIRPRIVPYTGSLEYILPLANAFESVREASI